MLKTGKLKSIFNCKAYKLKYILRWVCSLRHNTYNIFILENNSLYKIDSIKEILKFGTG